MCPPLPDTAPPLACKTPATVVVCDDQMATVPPWPDCVADASTKALVLTCTVLASGVAASGLAAVVPTKIWPPPLAPVAEVTEPDSNVTWLPVMVTSPPMAAAELAATVPLCVTVLARKLILPPLLVMPVAEITPVF